jgi:ribulose-bisphosphate carboxylase large chain
MKYEDYVDLKYKPDKNDLICDFFVEPLGINLKKAAGAVAAESSIGTWTETTTTKPYVEKLAAKVFEIKGNNIKIAYPIELFEPGNMPNILSSVAGNVFGMKDLKNLRLNNIHIPEKLLRSFKGPKYGIQGIRKLLKIPKRPLLGTIVKPKLGLKTEDHAKVAYEAWVGGCDIVKDDENLSSQTFNRFEERLQKTFKAKEKAERESGEKKIYMINITSEAEEMMRRAKLVEDLGNEYVMVDIITTGWSALQSLRNKDFNLVLHAHRAGHAAFTKNPKHGISMKVIAKLARIIGIDQLHVGTAVGKMYETKEEVLENCKALKEKMWKLKPVMPVASGGLHAGHVPELVKIFGNDFVIQAGGGMHALGTRTGAKAMRQALDATMKKIPLKEYSKNHRELKAALEKFE